MRRRHFLQFTGALTLFSLIETICVHSLWATMSNTMVIIEGFDFRSNPLSASDWGGLYFLDKEENPILNPLRQAEKGKLQTALPNFPVVIAMGLQVYGFGEVTLYADNQGRGYTASDFPLNLNVELAETRLFRVRTVIKSWKRSGFLLPVRVSQRLRRAQIYLNNAKNSLDSSEQVGWCQQSLYESLWAGEEAVLGKAKWEIQHRGKRPDFHFGCNFFGFSEADKSYRTYFTELFDFATIPLYWQSLEPQKGQKKYEDLDKTIAWLNQHQITPKGHPLVWFAEYGLPDWLQDQSFSSMQVKIADHIREVTQYFGDRLPYYDVINEGSGLSFANQPNYTVEELVELTKIASVSCHQGNPDTFRIINNCCLWARYRTNETTNPDTPYQYMKACLDAEVPFEAIGLQLYYPNHDLLEIDRLLERFGRLGKTIHLTELGVPSATTEDENSFMKTPFGLWHKPWSETIQADWIEQFYTLCYSKPYIEAITWWDLSDQINHFWPHGGLLNTEGKPKKSFYRLKDLLQQWRS